MAKLKEPRGYAEDFDPDWYLEHYVKTINQQIGNKGIYSFAMDSLHDIFSAGKIGTIRVWERVAAYALNLWYIPGKYKGVKLLDLGTGPSILSVISASQHVQEIQLSDINARCREILQAWLTGVDNCPEIFEYICRKEGKGLTIAQRSEEVRKKVTKILEVDLREPDPLKDARSSYDIITASLVFCSIARTEADYTDLLKKVIALLRPKGLLVVIDVLNSSYYQVGEFRFPDPDIEGWKMKGLFLKENLKILEWKETSPEGYMPEYGGSIANEEGCFTMICQKE